LAVERHQLMQERGSGSPMAEDENRTPDLDFIQRIAKQRVLKSLQTGQHQSRGTEPEIDEPGDRGIGVLASNSAPRRKTEIEERPEKRLD
jgi:hypothetical protein